MSLYLFDSINKCLKSFLFRDIVDGTLYALGWNSSNEEILLRSANPPTMYKDNDVKESNFNSKQTSPISIFWNKRIELLSENES